MKIASVAAALAGVSGFALVAGPAGAQPTAPANADYDWSGPYVDLNLGWDRTDSHPGAGTATVQQVTGASNGLTTVTVPPATFPTHATRYSNDTAAGGGGLGYNRQFGHIVVGVEGDMDRVIQGRANEDSPYTLPATGLTTGSAVTLNRYTTPDWTATLRGRLGWAAGPVMIYGTGGAAWESVTQAAVYSYGPAPTAAAAGANPAATFGPFTNASYSGRILPGWTIGAGAELALTRRITVGAEYRYMDFGHPQYAFGSNAPDATSETTRIGLRDNQVMAKVNFHFGPGIF
jgi:outer membrane immunogenic protein